MGKYPAPSNIEEHKDQVWQMLLLMFKLEKHFSEKEVQNALRSLAGDAALWVYVNSESHHTDDYLDHAKEIIANLKVTV